MTPEIATGLFGLLGALVGGGATFGVGYLSSRVQRAHAEQARVNEVADAEQARRSQLADARNAAYIVFLSRVDSFLDQARELEELLDLVSTEERPTDQYRQYVAEWNELVTANATVQLAGPEPTAHRAQDLLDAVGTYSEMIDKRYRGQRWPPGLATAWDRARENRLAFLQSARQTYAAGFGVETTPA
ncbi:hypothetical protein GKC29_18450 [Micromonospora sp. WMMC415]|uniref:hypothetical protein n=1 Tax=Micromonospora sp. WMMC415 TaxID=2675222 RepID=UPI0012B4CEB8|nr:hypothetical protein [Micromonospora sp. WMMC415]QGN48612.1 hypothetical protein GKC29_18450 [Micromonospora sp. WMMC415]